MASWEAAVVDLTRAPQEGALPPAAWAARVSALLGSSGMALPSQDLARVLVSHVCWDNNVPAAWKYLEVAIDSGLAHPMLVVALLSTRVFPARSYRPAAYRLYLEILTRHAFSFSSQIGAVYKEILTSIDDILQLSQTFGIQTSEPAVLLVEFIVCIVWQLVDACLEDEMLLDSISDKTSRWITRLRTMETDQSHKFIDGTMQLSYELCKLNTIMAIEIIGQFLYCKTIYKLIFLACQNIIPCMEAFVQRLHLLGAKSIALRNSNVSPETLMRFSLGDFGKGCSKCSSIHQKEYCIAFAGSLASSSGHCHESVGSAVWIPLDLYLEDCIGGTVAATNAIHVISGLLMAIQSINKTTWHDAFTALWIASLRLVQRERVPFEGPIPHIDARMCILLTIATLSVHEIIDEERRYLSADAECNSCTLPMKSSLGPRSEALISSLQMLGDYEGLLAPPPSVASLANQAAAKAVIYVSGPHVGDGSSESICVNEIAPNCSGNLRHLIVESCITRNLLSTSAYYWPGYVNRCVNQTSHSVQSQPPGWSSFMKGSQLTSLVADTLIKSPAPSLAELERIFEFALHGSHSERACAASVLCGASLTRGWNIQEHAVRFVLKLLHPPAPADCSGSMHYLLDHGPVMNILLTAISSVDCVQIFSFHGLVPELACALMEICEIFGSCSPNISWTISAAEVISAHTVFSNSFILLLRLWKFNQTPLEHCLMGSGAPVGSQLTLQYLLLLRNSPIFSSSGDTTKENNSNDFLVGAASDFILLDSYPKLMVWYQQHQSCLASTVSGLIPGTPVHQNVDNLLNMMFSKTNRVLNPFVGSGATVSYSISGSPSTVSEETKLRTDLPAWDILEAVPFVVDAALTACSHGQLSPRELATGLKDLADFLPASLATIICYLSSEVTRGVWQPANMNGTDWPSPAANLATVEENIKKIVGATGVDVPSLSKDLTSCDAPARIHLAMDL